MATRRNWNGMLIISALLIAAHGQQLLSNKCDFSQRHQILTCINVNLKSSDLGSMVKEDTHMLVIKGSNRLEIPPNYHFNPNFQHITSYQLVNNGVVEISNFAFYEMKNLRYLKINNNNLWSILQSNTFAGLHQLETLNIANNSIQNLENDAFKDLDNLDVLELTYNKIRVVPSFIFKPLESVTSLFLYHNGIEELEDQCFQGLTEVQLLDITHNNLRVIRASVFGPLLKLSDLYLSFNHIEVIEGEFALPTLKFLYLKNNKLKSISNTVFNSSLSLKAIDLSHNEISSISEDAFYHLASLDHVNLGHNVATSFNLKFSDTNKPHTAL